MSSDDKPTAADPPEEDDVSTAESMRSVSAFDLAPPLADEPRPTPEGADSVTAESMRSITNFDLASAVEREHSKPEITEDVWGGTSTRVDDVVPDHVDLSSHALSAPGAALEELKEESAELTARQPHRYFSRPAAPLPTLGEQTRRQVLKWGAFTALAGAVGLNLWGRRPVQTPAQEFKPSSMSQGDFVTLQHAFHAILGDRVSAKRAAAMADLRYQRLGAGPSERLAADLRILELGSASLLDGRRFTRLSIEEAEAVLDSWADSSLQSRRRVRADLEHLARWCWATHPETRVELGLTVPGRG